MPMQHGHNFVIEWRGPSLTHTPKYFIVDADAMPEVFRKVAQAKQLLEDGTQLPQQPLIFSPPMPAGTPTG